ncbi:MAG: dihydroneopterin aldolase [Catalinimonas sp.]
MPRHTVALEGLDFYAYHGFHDEERRLGNRYTVDVRLELDLTDAGTTDDLARTVDYGEVYARVTAVMQTPARLLEHVARQIIVRVLADFPPVTEVEVSVAKHNPPLGGLCRRARITLREGRAGADAR